MVPIEIPHNKDEVSIEPLRSWRTIRTRVAGYFLLQPGEARAFGYFALLFFLVGTGLALGRGSANALFLKRYGVAHLPETLVLIGLALFAASAVYGALADRARPERLLVGLLLSLAALLGVNWVLIAEASVAAAYPAYYIVFELASELLALHATFYFASNFDTLQAKRLLPLALASLQAGEMCGSAGFAALAATFGGEYGALAWCALAVGAAALVTWHHAAKGPSLFFHSSRKGGRELARAFDRLAQGLRFTRASPLLRFTAIGIFFMVVALYCAGFAARTVLVGAFPSEAELGIVFGMVGFVSATVALLVQAFFTSKLLNRFGVRTMNLVFPVTTVAAVGALVLAPGVAAALLIMLNRRIVMPAFRNPARGLLFEALPDWMQGRARALSLGLVLPLALLTAGGLLRLLGDAPLPVVLLPAFLGGAAYLYYSGRANAAYVSSMLATLRERLYLPSVQADELGRGIDERLVDELAKGVMHPDEQICIAYARILVKACPERAAELILQRAQTADVRTRDALLRLAGPHLSARLIDHLGEGTDAHEQSTLLELRINAQDGSARRLIVECLSAQNPRLIGCGIGGAAQHGDAELRASAAVALRGLLAGNSEAMLMAGLTALGKAPDEEHLPRLYPLLENPSLRVQRAALQALAQFGSADAKTLEPLLARARESSDHQVRAASVRCFPLLPAATRERLCLDALGDTHPAVAEAALTVLRRNCEQFEPVLYRWLCGATVQPRAQQRAINHLNRLGLMRAALSEVATHKTAVAETLARALGAPGLAGGDGAQASARALLAIVLRERLEQTIDLVLAAVEPSADPRSLRIIRAGLRCRQRRQVARAIEVLSHLEIPLLSTRLRPPLLLLAGAPAREAGSDRDAEEALRWVRHGADEWLRQCASVAFDRFPAGAVAA